MGDPDDKTGFRRACGEVTSGTSGVGVRDPMGRSRRDPSAPGVSSFGDIDPTIVAGLFGDPGPEVTYVEPGVYFRGADFELEYFSLFYPHKNK